MIRGSVAAVNIGGPILSIMWDNVSILIFPGHFRVSSATRMAWPPDFLLAMGELERKIMAHLKSLGFDIVGIRQGFTDGLPRCAEERVRRVTHPKVLRQRVASVISPAISCFSDGPPASLAGVRRNIAGYARGDEYHQALKARLRESSAGLPADCREPACSG